MSAEVALLCAADDMSAAVANALAREFGPIPIVVEQKESRKTFLKRRIKRLGLAAVLGQVAFVAAVPLLRRRSRARIEEIVAGGGLDLDRRIFDDALQVPSINGPEALEWLRRERPKVVVVNGTRIIARRVLDATDAVFINTHCGITPEYRGAHGGYWALYNSDPDHCGVTVHLVDAGIDTGGILAQARIEPTPRDNFVTYPYLQIATALPLLLREVRTALREGVAPTPREAVSGMWYHPTLFQYLKQGLLRGVW
ncbi:MAG: formyl transferase [Pseudomonadota bacterium]|nr:formyl transferase [Pseudomonadota bacterium]